LEKTRLAEDYARKKHSNQLRKDGVTTYYEHLKSVAERLRDLGITDEDILSAAWLHDVIEDTDSTFDNIDSLFGGKVALMVLVLTKDKTLPKKIMESQYVENLKNASFDAKIIKLCDISSNLSAIHNSNLSHSSKAKKIKQISKYLHAINYEIVENQLKFPNLIKILESSNKILDQYKN
jgi:guanosine-3',5'-bis(diphosphate) 3'-pyrophosphohydrolase